MSGSTSDAKVRHRMDEGEAMDVRQIVDDGTKPLSIGSAGSCNAGTITGLSYGTCANPYADNSDPGWSPERQMQDFMKAGTYGLMPFYVFQGVVGRYPPGKTDKKYYSYCQRFRAYIRKEKLGKVTSGPKHINEAYHPDHVGQVFIWTVDIKALKAWSLKHPLIPEKTAAQKLAEAAAKGPSVIAEGARK